MPRILYITSCWPHGEAFGGQLRALQIGRALRNVGDVTLVVASADVADDETMRKTAEEFFTLPAVGVNTVPNKALHHKLRRAFDTRFLNVHGSLADICDITRLLNSLKNFDLVWILNSRTPNILNQWHWPRSVLDIDDL